MNKDKVLTYLEAGISLEAVVLEMAKGEDEAFKEQVKKLLDMQQFPDKKKDLELKFHVLTEKINMLDEHLKQGLDETYIKQLAEKYFETLMRMQKALNKLI